MTRAAWLVSLSVALVFLANPASAQQKLPTVAELMGKLKDKRDSGGIQRYKLEFERTGYANGQPGTKCQSAYEFVFDWNSGKYREDGWDGCTPQPFEILKIYDGVQTKTKFRSVTKDRKPVGDGSWKYGFSTGRMNSGGFQAEYWPVFFHKGVIAGLNDGFFPGHFVFDPDAEKFFVHAEVVRDGRKCVSLKTFPEHPISQMQYEYIIDPTKDQAVVGFVYFQKAKPFFTLDIDVVATKQPGSWAPRKWTFTMFDGKGGAEVVVKVKVTDFAENVVVGEDNPFDIVPPEGGTVGRSHYALPEGKQDQKIDFYEYKVEKGKLVQTSGPAPPLWDRLLDNWHWFALTAGLVAAAFVGARVRGWRRGPVAPIPPSGG